MLFKELLSHLMHLSRTTNSMLAKALNVDASLVSRWKNGSRSPLRNPLLLSALSHYFAERLHGQYGIAELCGLLGLQDERLLQAEDMQKLLMLIWVESGLVEKDTSAGTDMFHQAGIAKRYAAIAALLRRQQRTERMPYRFSCS